MGSQCSCLRRRLACSNLRNLRMSLDAELCTCWSGLITSSSEVVTDTEIVTPHSTPISYVVRDERKQYRRNRRMLRTAVVDSRDSDLTVTVPSQSECVANQTSSQTPSQSDDNSQMVRKENVMKTRSGRIVKIPARFRDDDVQVVV